MNSYKKYLLDRSGTIQKKFWIPIVLVFFGSLTICFCSIFLLLVADVKFFGILVAWITFVPIFGCKLLEYFQFELVEYMEDKFVEINENKMITLELVSNEEISVSKFFFSQLMFSFRARDTNNINALTRGKFDLKLVFDIHFENGQKKVTATMPQKRLANFLLASSNYLKEAEWKIIKNEKINEQKFCAGINVVPKLNNLHPIVQSKNPESTKKFQKYLQDLSQKKDFKIQIQYCFVFPSQISKKIYNQEFQEYIKELNQKYNFQSVIETNMTEQQRVKSLQKIIPEVEIKRFNNIFAKLGKPWFNLAWKIVVLSDDFDLAQDTLGKIQKAFLGFFSEENFDLTFEHEGSSNQSYYKQNISEIGLERKWLYQNFVFPNETTEKYLAPLYQKYYFEKENLYRSKVWLNSINQKHPQKPLPASIMMIDILTTESIISF
jgi:hypothetical protein